jgi:hypothetical protein
LCLEFCGASPSGFEIASNKDLTEKIENNLLRDRCEQGNFDIAFYQSQTAFPEFALTYRVVSEWSVQSMLSLLSPDIFSADLNWCSSGMLRFISQIKLCTTEVNPSLWALIVLDIFSDSKEYVS